MVTKWILLYHTFFFILGSYLLLQIVFTSLMFLFFKPASDTVIKIHGFYIEIDGITYQIWDLPEFYMAIMVSTVLIFGMVYFITWLSVKKRPLWYLGFRPMSMEFFVWFIYITVVLGVGIIIKEYVIKSTEVLIRVVTLKEKIMLILGLGLFAPFVEELIFRGYLISRMDDFLNDKKRWITVVVSSLLFAGFHFQYNLAELSYIFVIGVFLAMMRLKTGSIWFPILFHVLGNLYAVSLILA